MAAAISIGQWLKRSERSWGTLAQGAVWIMGVVGSFLLPPPLGVESAEDKTWLHFGQFVAAVCIGLIFFGVFRWNRTCHARWWWLTALLALLLAGAAFFRYQQLTYLWTARYVDQKVVVGSEYTQAGRAYLEKNPGLSRDDLLFDFTGRAEDVWTRESIDRRRLKLAALYVASLPLFTLCVIAVVQSLQCLRAGMPRKKRRGRSLGRESDSSRAGEATSPRR